MSTTNDRIGELGQLARGLAGTPDEVARLQLAVDTAVALLPRCDHAGITINEKRGIVTRVGSDDVAKRANELQYELDEGPCLDVRRDQVTLVCPDLSSERRYASWAPRVRAELGVGSMMSLLVHTDEQSYGCLALYAQDGKRFEADDLAVAEALADHLAVIMAASREIDHLGVALHNRLTIGRAEGILMERLDLSEHQAFDYLRRASSHTNRKLVTIADDIVRTRQLPTLD